MQAYYLHKAALCEKAATCGVFTPGACLRYKRLARRFTLLAQKEAA